MSMTEKIRIALVKRGNMSETQLAKRLGTTPQNLHNKMKRDNFTISDLEKIAEALDCRLAVDFVDVETGKAL